MGNFFLLIMWKIKKIKFHPSSKQTAQHLSERCSEQQQRASVNLRVCAGFSYKLVKVLISAKLENKHIYFPDFSCWGKNGGRYSVPAGELCVQNELSERGKAPTLTEAWNPWCMSMKSDFLLCTVRGCNSSLTRAWHSKLAPASPQGFNISQVWEKILL